MTATPELPNNSTAGHDPNKAGHLSNLPYDHVPITDFYNEESQVSEEDLTKLQTGEYWSERPPVQELPAPEKKKVSLGIKIGAVAAGLAAVGGAAWYGMTGGGKINIPENTRPTAEAPVTPGAAAPIETTPAATETDPATIQPEIAPKNQQIFHDANGQEQTYEERVAENAVSTKEFPTGKDGFIGFFERAEQMAEYYPTEEEVRKNLSLPADYPLDRNLYALAAEVHNKTFDQIFDQPGSLDGNNLYAVVNKVAVTNVKMRYDRLNDNDATNDSVPFDATYKLDESNPLYFSYHDNTFDVEPTKYRMAFTRDISRTNSTSPNWQIPSNTKISSAPVK